MRRRVRKEKMKGCVQKGRRGNKVVERKNGTC